MRPSGTQNALITARLVWHTQNRLIIYTQKKFFGFFSLFVCLLRNYFIYILYIYASLQVNYVDNHEALKPVPSLSPYPEVTNSCILDISHLIYFSHKDFLTLWFFFSPLPRMAIFCYWLFVWVPLFIYLIESMQWKNSSQCQLHLPYSSIKVTKITHFLQVRVLVIDLTPLLNPSKCWVLLG